MPKVSIYLPDALYADVRAKDIAISAVAQSALEAAVRRKQNAEWVSAARSRPLRAGAPIDTGALLDDVREAFGT